MSSSVFKTDAMHWVCTGSCLVPTVQVAEQVSQHHREGEHTPCQRNNARNSAKKQIWALFQGMISVGQILDAGNLGDENSFKDEEKGKSKGRVSRLFFLNRHGMSNAHFRWPLGSGL